MPTDMTLSFRLFMRLLMPIAVLYGVLPVAAQPFVTRPCKEEIRSLRLRYADGSLERPVLTLGADGTIDGSDPHNTLDISFDCLGHDIRHYTCSLMLLNRDGMPADPASYDYLRGFTTADITDYTLSSGTQQIYTHYAFQFPNADMVLTRSGNYVLHIYEDGNPDNRVAEVCFLVAEPLAGISATVRPNTGMELNGRFQQLDISIDTRHLPGCHADEITLVVSQNERTDNTAVITRPTFVEPSRLRYENQNALIFEGGNEYRHLDIYSVYFAGWNVDRVLFDRGEYHAFLEPDENRGVTAVTGPTGAPYLSADDNNGQFVINAERTDDTDTEADYMWVHWSFPMEQPFFDGAVYVGGDLFQNRLTINNRMIYDNERHCYYLNALLKQGAYDYQYLFLPKERSGGPDRQTGLLPVRTDTPPCEQGATLLRTEGSHWETENRYAVYVWYRPFGERADRLVGYGIFR